jgi:ferritin-like protein
MEATPWLPGQHERYKRALEAAWDEFETAYYGTVKRVGLQSMASQHAQNYMRRARMLKQMVDGLLARPTRTDETPDTIRKAVAELSSYKRGLSQL